MIFQLTVSSSARVEHGPVRLGSGINRNRNQIPSVFKIKNRNRRLGFDLKNPGSVISDSVSVTKPTTIKLKNNIQTRQIYVHNPQIKINTVANLKFQHQITRAHSLFKLLQMRISRHNQRQKKNRSLPNEHTE